MLSSSCFWYNNNRRKQGREKLMEKVCQWCESVYEGRKDSRYCKQPHEKPCDNCGVLFFIKEMKRPAKTCSKACADKMTEKNKPQIKKQCSVCHEDFIARKVSDKICSKVHTKQCVVCNSSFTPSRLKDSREAKTCSKKCAAKITDFTARNQKSISTNLKKYGVENPSQVAEIKEKKRITTQSNYQVDNPSQSHIVQQKREDTLLKNYGVINPMFNDSIKTALKEKMIEKYGVTSPAMNKEIQKKMKATIFEKYGVENIFLLPENQLKAAQNSGIRISKVNKAWQKVLKEETNIDFEFEMLFANNKYADLGYENILIDINPTFTHNATISFVHATGRCQTDNCNKKAHAPRYNNYHYDRALAAAAEGKILLQYFDWYNPEIFMNIVKSKLKMNTNKIYARKTVLKEVSQSEANKFFKKNHLNGPSNMQELCIGLFYEGEMVHCQTYGKARFNKHFEWEAIRSCSKLDYQIQGGFSKCDKYFFNKINPNSVISYVDLSISQGTTETMFNDWKEHATNKASATWVYIGKDNTKPLFLTESAVRRVSADRLLGFEIGDKYPRYDTLGQKVTNDDILLQEEYVKVYNAGSKTFSWTKPSNN